jgi:hypothetical protein
MKKMPYEAIDSLKEIKESISGTEVDPENNIKELVNEYTSSLINHHEEISLNDFIDILRRMQNNNPSDSKFKAREEIINFLTRKNEEKIKNSVKSKELIKTNVQSISSKNVQNITNQPLNVLDENWHGKTKEINDSNQKLKTQRNKLIKNNEQLMLSIETIEETNKELDDIKKQLKAQENILKKNNEQSMLSIETIEDENRELDETKKQLIVQGSTIGKEIEKLKEQLEPYEKEKQHLLNKQSKILFDYRNKFNALRELVSENELIIKGFNKLGFNDSDVDKSLNVMDFQDENVSFDNLITTYKKLLEYPVVNWHRKFEYYLEKLDLSDEKKLVFVKELSEKLSLVLLIPKTNDRFNALEHTAQSEEESNDVERGRVTRVVSVGIKDTDAVKLKAKVILSK